MEKSASWTSSGTENHAVGATAVEVKQHSLIYA